MKRFLVAVGAAMLVACGAGPSDDGADIAPVGEDANDVTAMSKLIGSYEGGKGRFASLALTQTTSADGKRHNVFTASENVECVRAPCPPIALEGRWFAAGASLSLYMDASPTQTYKTKLEGTVLTLIDGRGVEVAELTKRPAISAGVAAALKKYGVEQMKVEIDPAEVDAQSKGAKRSFDDAVDVALGLFLADEAALPGWVAEQGPDELPECKGKTGAKLVTCVANTGASVHVMSRADSPPEEGDVATDWVVVFSDGRSDYGYFAIVPKDGKGEATIYSFN